MRRRSFLSWFGFGWIVSRLPIAVTGFLAACTRQTQANPGEKEKSADGFRKVGTTADLDQKGQILIEQKPNPILVVRDPGNPKTILAVNPTCTHQGCLVNWKGDKKSFICPCHNSVFAPDGKVLQGPAAKPLPTYAVKLDGQAISVKAG
jgi:cytochrome b6-f complex iron-sulfur subunit